MSALEAVIAANRFGFGARPGQLNKIAADPRGWLEAQIRPLEPVKGVEGAVQRIQRLLAGADNPNRIAEALKKARPLYIDDVVARTVRAINAENSFAERLVHFWSNHLAVSIDRAQVIPLVIPYENEAIRPHIFGRFSDLILASARHPAMLMYLDNVRSFGPNSPFIRNRNARNTNGGKGPQGLNENYAREVMELHTLGVDGGYTQADVRNLAKILTGWSVDKQSGAFAYRAPAHEPGPQTVLGRSFADQGQQQGIAALYFISTHPATARHIATKLARHFIADDPPQSAVDALADTFQQTNGDLAAVTRKLISLDEAWQPEPRKYKSPHDHVVSALRAIGTRTVDEGVVGSFEALGQRCFGAPSPQGWPDTETSWLSGDGLMHRIEWSQSLASRLPSSVDARKVAPDALGPWLNGDTAFLLQGAPSPADAIALLFLAPEFQRR